MSDIHSSLLWFPDSFYNRNERLQRAVSEGKHIPENLLPGRLLMAVSPDFRTKLIQADLSNVAPWWIKVAVETAPTFRQLVSSR